MSNTTDPQDGTITCVCGLDVTVLGAYTRENPRLCKCGREYLWEPGIGLTRNGLLAPALFLDLDGTVRRSKSGDFVKGPEDVELYPDVEGIIWDYRNRGFLVFGVTNQGGVAFGHKTIGDVLAENRATTDAFEHNPFCKIFFCPMHPGGTVHPFNVRSLTRKPDYGMLVLAEVFASHELGYMIDWPQSLMVGDRDEDQQMAEKAGVSFISADAFFNRAPEQGIPERKQRAV
jgi:D-glycero-D-manno-heptose 1,7-bisphosphate phosphatase